jgi:hypothetical protein
VLEIRVEGHVVALGEEILSTGKDHGVGGKVPEIQLLVKGKHVL